MLELEPVLAETPFFKGLSTAHLHQIAGCASEAQFDAGHSIIREGEPADFFYLIQHGEVGIEVQGPGERPLILQTLSAGDVLGWSWIVPPYEWHFNARARGTVRALCMDATCLRGHMNMNTALGYALLSRFLPIVVARLEATRLQLLDLYGD